MFFSGMKITISPAAVERVYNWPDKPRSKRLIKKMTRKRGPQITNKPAAFQTPFGLVVHPDIYTLLRDRPHDR